MSKLLVLGGFVTAMSVLTASFPASAQTADHHPGATAGPAATATLDDKKAWFRDAIDDVLTGSGPLTMQGRSEARIQHRH